MTAEEEFNHYVGQLALLAPELGLGTVDRINISVQASGQLPYQLVIREEDVPIAGLAYVDAQALADATSSQAEPNTEHGSSL